MQIWGLCWWHQTSVKRRTPASTFAACRVHIGEGSWGSLWSIGEYFPCKFVTFVALARVKMNISVWCWKMEEVQYLNLVMRKHILFCMRVEYSWLRKHVKPRSRFSKINLVIITWNKGISYVSQTQQKAWSQTSLCSGQVTQRSLSLACPGIKIPPGKDHQVPGTTIFQCCDSIINHVTSQATELSDQNLPLKDQAPWGRTCS